MYHFNGFYFKSEENKPTYPGLFSSNTLLQKVLLHLSYPFAFWSCCSIQEGYMRWKDNGEMFKAVGLGHPLKDSGGMTQLYSILNSKKAF